LPRQLKPGVAIEALPTKPDVDLTGPEERKAPPEIPVLRADKLEFAELPELRPSLTRAELPELPNECHCPSLIAGRKFEARFSPEPKPRPASDLP
jgi:hypothetical protein